MMKINSFAENIPDENLLPDEALQKLQDSQFLNKILEKLHSKLPRSFNTPLSRRNDF